MEGLELGIQTHRRSAKDRFSMGIIRNGVVLAMKGYDICFAKSFAASAIGWGAPNRETLLGPFRVWEYPRYFRSRRV